MKVVLEVDILDKDLPELEEVLQHMTEAKKLASYRIVDIWERVETDDLLLDIPEEGHTDNYDAAHAKEWMERHPYGYYNNEHDYGEVCDDD